LLRRKVYWSRYRIWIIRHNPMMCNGSSHCNLRANCDGYGISWIGDLSDIQYPPKMLFVDIQCLIMHIVGQLFTCKRLGVISVLLEFQFTNHSWESLLEFHQRNGTWPFIKLLNSPIGPVDLHGVYGCRGHNLHWNTWWWCESWCRNKRTSLINPSKWTLMYYWWM